MSYPLREWALSVLVPLSCNVINTSLRRTFGTRPAWQATPRVSGRSLLGSLRGLWCDTVLEYEHLQLQDNGPAPLHQLLASMATRNDTRSRSSGCERLGP